MLSAAATAAASLFAWIPCPVDMSRHLNDVRLPIGETAQPWQLSHWRQSAPLSLQSLRGKVVLVRWFTDSVCPHCRATAPALNEFHDEFAARGLEVVGVYHHKSREPFQPDSLDAVIASYHFRFPIAVDEDWRTLRRWYLDGHDRAWTSVSFLLDRRGIIRHVHPGGRYVKGDAAYQSLRRKIEALLEEPAVPEGNP